MRQADRQHENDAGGEASGGDGVRMELMTTKYEAAEMHGFKRTNAGLIPVDWLEFTIGDLIRFEGGSQPEKSHFRATPQLGYIRMIQIRDYKSDRFEVYVPQGLARRFCAETDVMIGRYGPPVFQILQGLEGAYNVALIKAIPQPEIDPTYAFYFLKNEQLFSFVEKLSRRSSGQTGVNLGELRTYPLPLPPKREEQRAIAKALADADALIDSLEQLLTKKRQIKQGSMQELLTGRRRLPGFRSEWAERRLADLADIRSGGTPSTRQSEFWDGDIPWCTPTDITALFGSKYISNTQRSISEQGLKASSAELLPIGTVVMTSRATIGECAIAAAPLATNQGFKNFVPSAKTSGEFLYYLLSTQKQAFLALCSGSTFLEIGKRQLADFTVQCPADLDEQVAIAQVLSDMDTDLTALESRLTKARALKQAMAQALLTGRIRLTEGAAA